MGLFVRECKDLWPAVLAVAALERGDVAAYNRIFDAIVAHGLQDCYKTKPLVDGKTLLKALNIPNGPQVGEWMQKVIVWQIENPRGTIDECIEALKRLS